MATNGRLVGATPVVRSTGSKKRLARNLMQGFRQGQALEHATPFAGVPVPQKIEAVPADVVQPGEGRVKFRCQGVGVIAAVACEEPVPIAMPLAVDGDGIIEHGGGTDLGKEPRSQHLGDEPFTGRGNCRLFGRRWLIAGPATDMNPGTSRHGCSAICPGSSINPFAASRNPGGGS